MQNADPLTPDPFERVRHPLKARLLQVRRVEDLAPRMRRVVLGGDLAGFTSPGADDHVKLLIPPPGHERPALPEFGPQGPQFAPGVERPVTRDYTPRRFDPTRGELALDFVVHGHGPAASWAAQAAPGQWLGIAGPRGSRVPRAPLPWMLLAGDETALPAIARWIEELPPTTTQLIVRVEVDNPAHHLPLPTRPGLDLQWLYRDGSDPEDDQRLARALAALALPDQPGYAWIASESAQMRAARALLMAERGFTRHTLHGAGYWKRGVANHDDEH